MLRRLVFLGLVSAIAGCAQVPMATDAADAEGRTFAPPPPGKAALYVVRDGIVAGSPPLAISLGPRLVGDLTSFTWLRVDLDPGAYQMRIRGLESSGGLALQLAAGETTYVLVEPKFGGGAQGAIVSAEEGRRVALKGRRVEEIR